MALLVTVPSPAASQFPETTIPLELDGGWFTVLVESPSGDTLRFVLDTAAGISVLSERGMARLGAEDAGTTTLAGASGPESVRLARTPELTLVPGAVLEAAVRPVLRDATLTTEAGRTFDGVLGVDLLDDFRLLIDGPGRVLRLGDPRSEGEWDADLGPAIPFERVGSGFVGVEIEVNGVSTRSVLDTGARVVMLSPGGAREARVEPTGPSEPLETRGVGGAPVDGRAGFADHLRLGATAMDGVSLTIADLPIFRRIDGGAEGFLLVGSPFFQRCAVAIDYHAHELRICSEALPAGGPG